MQSSSNTYLSNLDHLRAFAAFMVFIWHFVHFSPHCPAMQCEGMYHIYTPFFSLLEQGYSGVALFMCISGYIFTYLTYGKRLHIGKFWLNRILRLFPLLLFWGITESFGLIETLMYEHGDKGPIFTAVIKKVLNPQGAWTIYIELQYYLVLPVILLAVRKFGPKTLLWFVLALMANRALVWFGTGSAQNIAYWTIMGHGDQFLLGTFAFHLEQRIKRIHPTPKLVLDGFGILGFIGILSLYEYMQFLGGLYEYGDHPSTHILWVFLPAIEGACYSLIIISYLQHPMPKYIDRPLSALGRWSYSIYLNHFQCVPFLYVFAVTRFGMGENFYGRLGIATFLIFPMLVLLCAFTYTIIEKPFLRLRQNYLLPDLKNP